MFSKLNNKRIQLSLHILNRPADDLQFYIAPKKIPIIWERYSRSRTKTHSKETISNPQIVSGAFTCEYCKINDR